MIFAISVVSAVSLANITTYTIPSSVNQSAGSFEIPFNLVNSGLNGTLDFSASTVSTGSIAFNDTTIADGSVTPVTETIKATVTFPTTATGTITGVINVTGTGMSTSKTLSFSVPITATSQSTPSEITTCTNTGNPGELKIKKIDFTNNGLSSGVTFGEDDQWLPFEDIEAEVQVKNDGNEDVNNIELNWGIWDTKKNEWVIEMDNLKDFDLKDGDTKTFTISFTIDDGVDMDLSDLSDGENYKFYVTATGEVDNDTAPSTCVADYQLESIVIESDFVVINNIEVPETVQCGETVQVTGQLWNVGDNDQDSVSLEVLGRESALKLNQNIDVGDINAFDNQEFSFSFIVPKGLDEKTYALKINVQDEDGNTYQNDFNDDYSEFTIPFAVQGGCSLEPQVSVLGAIVSGGQAGKPLVVKATITNTGDSTSIYNLNAIGFESWASSAALDQSLVSLNAGESKDVLVTLNVKDDASGSQTFSVQLSSNGQTITQPVSVSIAEASKGLFGITGSTISGNNWYIWGIGLLNLILVIVIIVVAVRIARK